MYFVFNFEFFIFENEKKRHTWFDRDLSAAGRVMLENPDGKFEHRLVNIKR